MLNCSSFLTLTYKHRKQATDEKVDFATIFLVDLGLGEIGNVYERPYISNIYNGMRDFSQAMKDAITTTAETRENCYKNIKTHLIPKLSEVTFEDYLNSLKLIIENDESISSKTKKTLLSFYEKDDKVRFIAEAFIYAVAQDNIVAVEKVRTEDLQFVLEVNQKCPLCNESFTKGKKKILYKYAITNIYPFGLSDELEATFNDIEPKPADMDSSYNKICLCPACASSYEFTPTSSVYTDLVGKKKHLLSEEVANNKIDSVSLDQEIVYVLKELQEKNDDEFREFRIIPLKIADKIENNNLLKHKIVIDVNMYYHYVRTALSNIDDDASEFKVIANSFNSCYLKLKKEDLTQEEIYYKIVEWVMRKAKLSDKYKTACQIIVSFFVQNCEVFDEISK